MNVIGCFSCPRTDVLKLREKRVLNSLSYKPNFTFFGYWLFAHWRPARELQLSSTLRVSGLLLVLQLISGCMGLPTRQLQAVAADQGLQESVIESTQFSHRVFRNSHALKDGQLNVYLEGDGLPWIFRYFVVPDPTPRWPLMLFLMKHDQNAALYLGRPCYNGFAKTAPCNSSLWTSGRYSAAVVNSMVEALRSAIEQSGASRINLFGHSGGGALALLMAERLVEVELIVTLAGNLDTDGWTGLHGYSPLYTSLNPVLRAPLNPSITQVHLMGGRDFNIPPVLARGWVSRQANSYGVIYKDYDHSCCWSATWKNLLLQINATGGSRAANGITPLRFARLPFKTPSEIPANQTFSDSGDIGKFEAKLPSYQ